MFAEGKCPDIVIGILDVVKKAATASTTIPSPRAFRSDCKNLWIIAPEIKENKISGIIVVNNGICGNIQVRDIDKKYYTVNVFVPPAESFAYIEEKTLNIRSPGVEGITKKLS